MSAAIGAAHRRSARLGLASVLGGRALALWRRSRRLGRPLQLRCRPRRGAGTHLCWRRLDWRRCGSRRSGRLRRLALLALSARQRRRLWLALPRWLSLRIVVLLAAAVIRLVLLRAARLPRLVLRWTRAGLLRLALPVAWCRGRLRSGTIVVLAGAGIRPLRCLRRAAVRREAGIGSAEGALLGDDLTADALRRMHLPHKALVAPDLARGDHHRDRGEARAGGARANRKAA